MAERPLLRFSFLLFLAIVLFSGTHASAQVIQNLPVVSTGSATAITDTSATLGGIVNPNSFATDASIMYGKTQTTKCSTLGTRSAILSVGGGTNNIPFTRPISGLTPNTTYYFCAVASNEVNSSAGIGDSFGAMASFKTTGAAPSSTATGGINPTTGGTNPTTGGTNPSTCPANTLCNPLQETSIQDLILKVIDVILVFLIPVIVLYIMYAGFLFVTAQGNAEQVSKARTALLYAILGGVIVLGARSIIAIIQGTITSL